MLTQAPLTELSLFSGAGGGLLASKYLLGWKTIGYVEIEEYPQRVLAQRIKDGLLDEAPIFTDIKAFNDSGCAELYLGITDVVSSGFPCQPFSVCGHQLGEKDPRNMWPDTMSTIRAVRPRFAFLENVPGLLVSGYIRTIFRDLAESGYDAKWCVLGGHDTGAVADGKRLWVVAFASDCTMLESMDIQKRYVPYKEESCRREHSRAVRKALSQDDYASIKRGSDVLACGMDRLKAIGNGQNPIVAATAWRILSGC